MKGLNLMAKVTINGKPVLNDGIAELIAVASKTDTIGATVLGVLPLLNLEVDYSKMTATCPNVKALASMVKESGAVVRVEDAGENPKPRTFTWETLIERLEVAVKMSPYALKADEISRTVKGNITWENSPKKAGKISAGLDFGGSLLG
jgi:hypothetical protein